jgi:hypothetical protein
MQCRTMTRMVNTTQKKKNWVRHVKLAAKKRWVQLCMALLLWLMVGLLTTLALKPKVIAKGDTSQFKFIRCDVCKMELPYSPDMANKRCPKCLPPKTGFLLPAKESLKEGAGALDPWRWVYSAVFLETVIFLAAIVYLLYLPVADLTKVYYVVCCPYCAQKLRYRAVSAGEIGSCSRCMRMIRFPEQEDAVLEADVLKAEEQAALAEQQALLEQEEMTE